MAEGKYGKYFLTNLAAEGRFCPRLVFFSKRYEVTSDKNFSLIWNCIKEPFVMVDNPHAHDFDQFLHFYGANSDDIADFDAVVEMSMGEELEVHTITEPTVLHIPAGMIHCPLEFKVVNKPIIFMNVAMTPEYIKVH